MDIAEFLIARCAEAEQHAQFCHMADCGAVAEYCGSCDCGLAARVLASLAAKRRLIDPNTWAGGPETEDAYQDMLRILAQPYAKHSDYDPVWAVD